MQRKIEEFLKRAVGTEAEQGPAYREEPIVRSIQESEPEQADADMLAERVAGELRFQMVVQVLLNGKAELKRSFPTGITVLIGRDTSCHLVLPSNHVSRRHVALSWDDAGLVVEDVSSGGTMIGKERLQHERRHLGIGTQMLLVGPYELRVSVTSYHEVQAGVRRQVQSRLLERLRLPERKLGEDVTPMLRAEVRSTLQQIVQEAALQIPQLERRRLVRELEDEALGLGPLEALLRDPQVSEIMVVDQNTIYAERAGRLELTGRHFTDADAVRSAIERIVTPLGRRIDESSPMVDARLKDGSRVNAIIPPLALRGPCVTIRKFPNHRLTMDDLVHGRSLDERMARFLERAVRLKKNVVISGGTGSGKTTLLNVLSAFIAEEERVVTIEDAAELALQQPHVVALESKPANLEGRGAFSIRDLVKNALRMRPDRIVVGECRGGEALDMLQAMNTGHEGSMTTTHANSPQQAVARLETLCLMSGVELPLVAIRRQIASSVHLIVQQSRLSCGGRKVLSITEVLGQDESGNVELRELFRFDHESEAHRATGYMPSFLQELSRNFAAETGALF